MIPPVDHAAILPATRPSSRVLTHPSRVLTHPPRLLPPAQLSPGLPRIPLPQQRPWFTIYNQMVVDNLTDAGVDLLFHALADSTRRDIVARAFSTEQSVSALAEHYAMSFAAVQKHVAVLERASLITKERRGRQQIVRGNPNAIRVASTLIDGFEQIWLARAARIGELLADEAPADRMPGGKAPEGAAPSTDASRQSAAPRPPDPQSAAPRPPDPQSLASQSPDLQPPDPQPPVPQRSAPQRSASRTNNRPH